jgi:nucleotide-binding universal stress UspA family protein
MYKTILLYLDDTPDRPARHEAVFRLAMEQQALLVGLAVTGRIQTDYLGDGLAVGMALPEIDYGPAIERARNRLRDFDELAGKFGVGARECRLVDSSAEMALLLHSRYSDLVVLDQAARATANPLVSAQLAPYLAVQGVTPVLVLPAGRDPVHIGRSIVIGWNGSREAQRAIDAALPLLAGADRVQLVILNATDTFAVHGEEPGADMAAKLARHGVKVEVVARTTKDEPGFALQQQAHDSGADLVVAGAYGHSRLQEWLMGGSTRNLLKQMHVPVLLAH